MKKNIFNLIGAMAARIAGSGAHFVANLLIAKMLSPSDAGILYIGISLTLISSTITRVGLDNFLLRQVAILADSRNWPIANNLIIKCILITLAASFTLVATLLLLGRFSLSSFEAIKDSAEILSVMIFAIPFFSVFILLSACFKAINRANLGITIESAAWPSLFCISTLGLFYFFQLKLTYLSYCFIVNSILITIFSIALWKKVTPGRAKISIKTLSYKKILTSSWPLMGIAVCHVVLRWSDTLWVGYFLPNSEVAIYTLASRMAGIFALFSAAITAIIAPKYAVSFANKDFQGIKKIFYQSVSVLFLTLTPILIFLYVFSEEVMLLFSYDYLPGEWTFKISLALQYLYSITVPIGYLLIMTGLEKTYFKLSLTSLALSQAMFFFLTPIFGIEGSALASGLPAVLLNLTLIVVSLKKIKKLQSPPLGLSTT